MGIDQVGGQVSGTAAVFLDRDGVINRNVLNPTTGEYESPGVPEDFHLAEGVIPALHTLQSAGFPLFLVSNQPNYAKGKNTMGDLRAVHERMLAVLDSAAVRFSEFYYCYHHPNGVVADFSGRCDCRKPSPYFLFKARDAFRISLEDSWFVGDRVSDVECGRAAGVRTIRVAEDHPANRAADEMPADYEARDLADAAAIILRHSRTRAGAPSLAATRV